MYQEREIRLDENSLEHILRILRKNVYSICMVALIMVFGIGIGYQLFFVPQYTSEATLAVQSKGSSAVNTYNYLSVANDMAVVYQEVFQNEVLYNAVAESTDGASLDTTVSTEVLPGTNLLVIRVTAKNPEVAYTVMQAILENYHIVSDQMFSNAVIEQVSNPKVPTEQVNSVSMWKMQLFGAVAGVVLTVVLLLVYAVFRNTIKTVKGAKRNIKGHYLGVIPHVQKTQSLMERLRRVNVGLLLTNPTLNNLFAQDFNQLALAIEYQMKRKKAKVLLITSILENEGKTTMAANLAITLAKINPDKKVLLLDMDFKSPASYKLFDKKAEDCQGLLAYLRGELEFSDILRYDEKSHIYQIFNSEHLAVSHKILRSEKTQQMREELCKQMDYILIDSAPFSAGADVQFLTDYVDASVMVIRQDGAKIQDVQEGIEVLSDSSGEYMGYILNDFNSLNQSLKYHVSKKDNIQV